MRLHGARGLTRITGRRTLAAVGVGAVFTGAALAVTGPAVATAATAPAAPSAPWPLSLAAASLQTFAGTGYPGFNGDFQIRTATQVNVPQGVATDALGDVFVADTGNNRIRKINPVGLVTTIAGNGKIGYGGDGGQATSTSLSYPNSVTVSPTGNVYIADTSANRVREVTIDGVIHTVAGTGVPGYSGDGGPACNAQIRQPEGLALDGFGDLFISDGVSDVIREVTPDGIIHTFAGNGTAGYNGDGIPARSASLNYPNGIAVDPARDVFIADTGDHRVREVTPDGLIQTLAGTGVTGYLGDHGLATAAELAAPVSVALDAHGDIFIGDTGNGTARVIVNGVITTVAGTGTPGASPDGLPGALSQLDYPAGLAVTQDGSLLIADSFVNRIRKLG